MVFMFPNSRGVCIRVLWISLQSPKLPFYEPLKTFNCNPYLLGTITLEPSTTWLPVVTLQDFIDHFLSLLFVQLESFQSCIIQFFFLSFITSIFHKGIPLDILLVFHYRGIQLLGLGAASRNPCMVEMVIWEQP